ncbi:unnamed protein product [Clonostachys rosea]|uniref:BZIP domain-containing protein n=1 Tax=Bionectria ochroleuca TaxID=29856 RepID=A0ABY6USF6_BIOOC|nr:unnamed protein product [Clonostachys rosea]
MPDKRLRGSTEYSSHPPTVRARARLDKLPEEKRRFELAKNREYNSMWQSCTRIARREEYRHADLESRRNMLISNLRAIMDKRRENGKLICGIDAEVMVKRHLRKDAALRAAQDGSRHVPIGLQGVSVEARLDHLDQEPLTTSDSWLESEGGQGPNLFEHHPVLGDYADNMDIAQLHDQLADTKQGMREMIRVQNYLTRVADQTLSIVSTVADSNRRLDAKLEYMIQFLQHPPRVAMPHTSTGFTPHNVPMASTMQPMQHPMQPMQGVQPEGFLPLNNLDPKSVSEQQQQQHPQQMEQQATQYIPDLTGI